MCETRALHDLGDHFRAQVMYSLEIKVLPTAHSQRE